MLHQMQIGETKRCTSNVLQNSRKEERLIVFNTCVSLIYYGEGLENILIFKQLYQNATIGKKNYKGLNVMVVYL
jgi:hypothetical protein